MFQLGLDRVAESALERSSRPCGNCVHAPAAGRITPDFVRHPAGNGEDMQIISTGPTVEARAWLRGNPSPYAFAANRFGTTERALAFVESLYAAGATQVLVHDPGVNSEGLPYADTLLVRFDSIEGRRALLRFCEERGPGRVPEGDFTMHVHDREIRLWWD